MRRRYQLLVIALALASSAGCYRTRIETIVVPYAALLYLDPADAAAGRTGCDIIGQPYRLVSHRVPPEFLPWVVLHENIHVKQMRAFSGGCVAFTVRYGTDERFRLSVEAEAFCGVHDAQKAAGLKPYPSLVDIVAYLMAQPADTAASYDGHWTADDVKRAMRCHDA